MIRKGFPSGSTFFIAETTSSGKTIFPLFESKARIKESGVYRGLKQEIISFSLAPAIMIMDLPLATSLVSMSNFGDELML